MTLILFILTYFIYSHGFYGTAFAQTCEASAERNAVHVSGEIGGKHAFSDTIDPGWVFSLEPSPFGWDLRLRDKAGMDLSQITPPFHGVPNPREIYGWHFRNKNNTAINTGDVNAPQHLRLFSFSPALSGTGGFRPSTGSVAPDPDEGRGWLKIYEMGLTDLEKGQRARMNYLKFNACLTWPKSPEETETELSRSSPVFLDEESETLFACGLDAKKYKLSAWVLPRLQNGDFDGDGSLDTAVPILRKVDSQRGLAICRAGTWIYVLGYGSIAQTNLKPDYYTFAQYLEKVEFWEILSEATQKDMLIMGQTEKSEINIGWDGYAFTFNLGQHLVEP